MIPKRDASRAIASVLLLTSYILGSAVIAENHWAQFEAWTMVCSYVLALATKLSLDKAFWHSSFELALLSARRSLDALVTECQGRAHLVEGHPLGDGYFYGARLTIVTGLVAAWSLNRRREYSPSTYPITFFQKSIRQSFFWGESAVPFLALTAIDLEMNCLSRDAERMMFELLHISAIANERGKRGVPDIFVSIEDAHTIQHRLKP